MNVRKQLRASVNLNMVKIRSSGGTYPSIVQKCHEIQYQFPNNVIENVTQYDKTIRGDRGLVIHIFYHTKGHKLFVIKMLDGNFKDRYVIAGKTSFKKLGKIIVKEEDWRINNKEVEDEDTNPSGCILSYDSSHSIC